MNQRKVQNITTASDYEELKKSFKFVVEDDDIDQTKNNLLWQDRMVQRYHQHLFKTHVIADLTQYKLDRIGLRWRTESEVTSGKGVETCGNKHCPYYEIANDKKTSGSSASAIGDLKEYKSFHKDVETEEEEEKLLLTLPHGYGLCDYDVHFAYEENGESKEELVKLRLCLRCAPMLFYNKGGALGALRARQKMDDEVFKNQDFDPTDEKSDKTKRKTVGEEYNEFSKKSNSKSRSRI